MTRLELFGKALEKCEELQKRYARDQAIHSIIKQLEYLISLEDGSNLNFSRVEDIIIGTLTLREIDQLDESVAEVLYEVDHQVQIMQRLVKSGQEGLIQNKKALFSL